MECYKALSEDDLFDKMKDNYGMCWKFGSYEPENKGIRMAILATKLLLQMTERNKEIDAEILNDLALLILQDSSTEFGQASQVLQLKSLVIFSELSKRRTQAESQEAPAIDGHAGDIGDGRDGLDSSSYLHLPLSPIRVKNEKDDWLEKMDDGQTKLESEEGQKENGEQRNIMTNEGRKIEVQKRTEKRQTVVKKGKKKNEERTPIARNERRKRAHSTDADNLDAGQSGTPNSMKRRAREVGSYEEKDEEEEHWMDNDIGNRRSDKQSKSVRASPIEKNSPVKLMQGCVQNTGQTPSMKVVGTSWKMSDQETSLLRKHLSNQLVMNSPLPKMAVIFGLKANIVDCPFCEETFGVRALGDHVRKMHGKEPEKLFGCTTCDVWCKSIQGAYFHNERRGCIVTIRSVEEARKAEKITNGGEAKMIHQKEHELADEISFNTEGDESKGNENGEDTETSNASTSRAAIPEATENNMEAIDYDDMASKLVVSASESYRARSMAVNNEQEHLFEIVVKNEY